MNYNKPGAHLPKNNSSRRELAPQEWTREPSEPSRRDVSPRGETPARPSGGKPAGRSKGRRGAATLLIVLLVLIVLVLAAYLVFQHFYGLLNFQARGTSTASEPYTVEAPQETAPEGVATLAPDDVQTLQDQLLSNIKANAEDLHYDDNVYNILLLGNDSRENGVSERTDAMVLVSVNQNTHQIVMSSFLRDIYLYIPGKDTYNRLNAANVYGGSDMTLNTIEQNFDVPIDNYAQVDFYSFIDIADALGGVDIELSQDEIDEMNEKMQEVNWYRAGYNDSLQMDGHISGGPGTYHLNGIQTLAYCRVRYADSDFGRTERQRKVLEQLWGKIKTLSITDAYNLLETLLPKVTTDLTEGQCLSLLLSVSKYMDYNVSSLYVPADDTYSLAMIDDMSVLKVDIDANKTILNNAIYGDGSGN